MILGLNAYHGDVSAALLRDGALIAGMEEERFRRMEHWAGFPLKAVCICLEMAGVPSQEISDVAVSRNPRAHFLCKALFALRNRPSLGLARDRMTNSRRVGDLAASLSEAVGRGSFAVLPSTRLVLR